LWGEEGDVRVRVWVHKSRIAGLGLFAAQDIKQGTRILPYLGEKVSKDESTRRLAQGNAYIFTFNDRYDIDGKILPMSGGDLCREIARVDGWGVIDRQDMEMVRGALGEGRRHLAGGQGMGTITIPILQRCG
jgi:hypothetical protein